MNIIISPDRFPSRDGLKRGVWAPVLFAPNPDTPERLVIAVAAVSESEFHVEAADAGKRLACLYGPAAATALMVQHSTVDALRQELASRGVSALEQPTQSFSGVTIGSVRSGEAASMRELAHRWLRTISSLHDPKDRQPEDADDTVETAIETMALQADNDKLPVLVYRAVEEHDPDLGGYFSADIRSRARRTPRPKPQKVFIGFAGKTVVANFATLKASQRPRPLVDHIKRLMWDLARHRDEEARLQGARSHEMIIFRRGESDPEFDDRKGAELQEMLGDLQEQGAEDDISVQDRTSVPAIAEHIRLVEKSMARL